MGLGPDITERGRPSLVQAVKDVTDICAGGMHTVCLTKEGSIFTFGCDDEGALGREATDENSFEPSEVPLPGRVIQVTAGDSHSAALLEDGRVFAWGSFRVSNTIHRIICWISSCKKINKLVYFRTRMVQWV